MVRMRKSSTLRTWCAALVLAPYLAFVLYVTLRPAPIDVSFRHDLDRLLEELHERSLPRMVTYNFIEFTGNIALFIPLGFIISLLLPRRIWWLVLIIGPLLSIAIELTQFALLPARYATVADVMSNSIGIVIGAVAAIFLRLLVSWRDELILRHALGEKPVEADAGIR